MKKITILLFYILLFISYGSCKKESLCACNVESPEQNLKWLNAIIQGLICEDIYQFFFEGSEFIIISTCDAASDRIEIVYDCNGTCLCQHGGKFPGSGCSLPTAFWEKYYKERILIYQVRTDPKSFK